MFATARVLGSCVLCLAVASCAARPETETLETIPSAIVGGVLEVEGSAVARRTVLFTPASSGGLHGCSATILDGSHALTAAHCLIGLADVSDPVLVFAPRFSAGATMRPVTGSKGHDDHLGVDLAVLTFSGGLPDGYIPVTLPDHLDLTPGTPVTEAGYGTTSADGDGSDRGILRSVETTFRQVDAPTQLLLIGTAGHGVCSGDSGGPDFVKVADDLVQVGVHSTGDCAGNSGSTNVRPNLAWIRAQLR